MGVIECRSQQRTLLDVTDKLYVFDQEHDIHDQFDMRQFPYIMSVSEYEWFSIYESELRVVNICD